MRMLYQSAFVLLLLSAPLLTTNALTPHQSNSRVANYSIGRYGTPGYEHFSFWVKEGGKLEILYAYGKSDNELRLAFSGRDICIGRPCFKVLFSNGREFYVRPSGLNLEVADAKRNYLKVFRWEYEGPRDGRGTFCSVCAEDEKEAMQVIKKHFLK